MNRTKRISRMYHQLQPEIEASRDHERLRREYFRLFMSNSKAKLASVAKSLNIRGRTTMDKVDLAMACAIRGATLTQQTGRKLPWT